MTHASLADLAALAADAADGSAAADDAARVHIAACVACRLAFDEQRDMRGLARRLPAPQLTSAQRAALAADVLARSEQTDVAPARRTRRIGATATMIVTAAAAAAAIAWYVQRPGSPAPEAARIAVAAPVDDLTGELSTGAAMPAVPAARLSGSGDHVREQTSTGDDVVRLSGGELTIDAVDARPIRVVGGDTVVDVRDARVTVVARHGVIAQVSVFSGSAEVSNAGARIKVDVGTVWQPPTTAEVAPARPPRTRNDSLAQFRIAWTALRAGDPRTAVAAFDRATDPAVAEDAAYWAAIASERMGDTAGARRRYDAFVARFPASVRIDEARAAIVRLRTPTEP